MGPNNHRHHLHYHQSIMATTTTFKPWFSSLHQQFNKAKTRRRKKLEYKMTSQIHLIFTTFLLFATTDLSSYLNSTNSKTVSSSSSSSIFLLTSASSVVAFSSSGVDAYFDSSSSSSSSSTGTGNGGLQLQHHQQQMCPPVCSCIWKGGKQTATCDRRGLASVPVGLVSTTQVVDLSGNSLYALPANVFMDRGLINLQRIYLVDCQLRDISAETFVKLSNLVELDLSNNSLTAVPSKSFFEAPSLRRLSLAGNRLREVRSAAFLSLGRLVVLDLSSNSLVHLEADAFRGLRSLQTLKLEGNQLASIAAADSFVQFLPPKMASLGLHDNRWRCDCHLKAVREWIAANNVPLPVKPVCSAPARLQGQKWDSISAHEFSCPPQIHSVTNHYYKHIGNNVTISCPVTGYPQPVIFWLFEGGSGGSGGGGSSSNSPGIELFKSRISSGGGGGGDHHAKSTSTSTTLVATNRSRSGGGSNGREAGAFSDDVTSAVLEESSSNPSSPSTTTTTTLSTPSLSTHSPSSSSEIHPHQNSNKPHHPQHLPHHPSAYEQLLPNFRYSVAQEMENSHQLISTLTVHSLKPSDSQRITCYARNIGGTVMKNFTLDVTIDDPFTSSRSMDFIVTEMFVIALSISILFLVVIIFVGCFIVKMRKRPGGSGSAVHAGENSGNSCTANGSVGGGDGGGVYGGVHNHHHHSVAAGAASTIQPFNDGGFIKQQPAIFTGWGTTTATATTNDLQNKEIILDGQTLQYTTPNGNTNTGGILMVDMSSQNSSQFNSSNVNHPHHQHHDHNNSTDLSSQSTTATSMTVNSVNGGGNGGVNQPNGVSPNGSSDTTSAGSLPPYYSATSNQYHLEEGVNGYATLQRNASFRQALVDQCSSQIPSHPQQPLSMTPDLLVNSTTTPSAGAYYLAEMSNGMNSRVNMINCDGYPQTLLHPQLPPQYHHFHHPHPHPHPQDPAFPLLNSGPLTMTEISAPLNQAELIYGTRIAPTRPSFPTMMMTSSASCHGNLGGGSYNSTNGKVSKVKFADQLEQQQQQLQQTGGQRSSTATDSYVYATIRKQQPLPPPTFPRPSINNSSNSSNSSSANSSFNNSSNSTEQQQQQQQPPSLKPLSAYHRGVGSYPEGFSSLLLLESSVDSGDQISSGAKKCLNRSVDSLDEAEEDDYYRTLNGGVLRNGNGTNTLPEVVTSTSSSATSSTELQHPQHHQQQQLKST